MNLISTSVTTGAVVIAGRWATDQPLTFNMAIGGVIYTIFLGMMDSFDSDLANKFALLVLASALLYYVPKIFKYRPPSTPAADRAGTNIGKAMRP